MGLLGVSLFQKYTGENPKEMPTERYCMHVSFRIAVLSAYQSSCVMITAAPRDSETTDRTIRRYRFRGGINGNIDILAKHAYVRKLLCVTNNDKACT